MPQELIRTPGDTAVLYSDPGKVRMRVNWGAIIAGWLVAVAIAAFLFALGSAIGMTGAVNISDIESAGKKAAVGATIWLFVTWFLSLYFGSFYASRVSSVDSREGALQGVAVWALSTVLTFMAGASGISAGGFLSLQAVKSAASGAASVGQHAGVPLDFQAQLKRDILNAVSSGTSVDREKLRETVDQLNPKTLNDIGVQFIKNDIQGAKNALTLNTSLSSEEADRVVSSLSHQVDELKAKIAEGARKVAAYTAAALWCSVIISVVAFAAAMFGGMAGACIKYH